MPEPCYSTSDIDYSIYVVGDMGALPAGSIDPVAEHLKQNIETANQKSCMAFLGDNIYPRGMPEIDNEKSSLAEQRINSQLSIVEHYNGRIIFIPGNHDCNKGHSDGWEYLKRQENYITEALHTKEVFLPPNGCPGPVLIQDSDHVSIIVINTQWWIQHGNKPMGKKDGCTVANAPDFFLQLKKKLDSVKNKNIFIIAHHPLYSNAIHGGKFKLKHHIFPFTLQKKKLYIPVPVLGSLYILYRKAFGAKEDMSFHTYRKMRKKLLKIFRLYPNLIYSSGHDHNLQHLKIGEQHYIVSGSGSKTSFVRHGGDALFSAARRGYFAIHYLKNLEVWIEAHLLSKETGKMQKAYCEKIDTAVN
jgi:hypothetical protein